MSVETKAASSPEVKRARVETSLLPRSSEGFPVERDMIFSPTSPPIHGEGLSQGWCNDTMMSVSQLQRVVVVASWKIFDNVGEHESCTRQGGIAVQGRYLSRYRCPMQTYGI